MDVEHTSRVISDLAPAMTLPPQALTSTVTAWSEWRWNKCGWWPYDSSVDCSSSCWEDNVVTWQFN
eukprot:scaffold34747_cov205-Skeletonema_dohrnii-CCMP3373.AAC.3